MTRLLLSLMLAALTATAAIAQMPPTDKDLPGKVQSDTPGLEGEGTLPPSGEPLPPADDVGASKPRATTGPVNPTAEPQSSDLPAGQKRTAPESP